METELWPNLFHACAREKIPLIVANARMSERSARAYGRVAGFTRSILADVTLVAAQGEADAARLRTLGARDVRITGNIKFDLHLPASLLEQAAVLRRAWGEDRLVWVAASTHAGEDEQVLDAYARVRRAVPDCLLVLVPRHPERFDDVAVLCRQRGYTLARRSEQGMGTLETAVLLVDRMGELPVFYAAGDVAFVGGSLVPTGGHNVLEPAALGKPVIVGPHTFNFLDITRQLIAAGGAVEIADAEQLTEAVLRYLADANLRDAAGRQGRALVEQNRGALARLQVLLDDYLRQ
ncbi:MAG: 3-deoxy-D-manno-octulosonic acid transferase, partial [Pseudomonadota bacterium]